MSAPTVARVVEIVVPRDPSAAGVAGIDPGSAIVRDPEARTAGRSLVHYEGARHAPMTARERIVSAAGRLAADYPTTAKRLVEDADLAVAALWDRELQIPATIVDAAAYEAWFGHPASDLVGPVLPLGPADAATRLAIAEWSVPKRWGTRVRIAGRQWCAVTGAGQVLTGHVDGDDATVHAYGDPAIPARLQPLLPDAPPRREGVDEGGPYATTSPSGEVVRHATLASAQGHVLSGSGARRVADARGWGLRCSLPHAVRILVTMEAPAHGELGARPRGAATWREARTLMAEAAVLARGDASFTLVAEFSDGSAHTRRVDARMEDGVARLGRDALPDAFAGLAATHQLEDVRWMWPA